MRTLIISDIHMGSPLFKSSQFLMNLLDDPFENVFILGDILDVWRDSLEDIEHEYEALIRRINNKARECNVTIVKGNHDPDISTLKMVFNRCNVHEKYAYLNDDTILLHGDQYDHMILKHSWLAKIVYCAHKFFSKFGINVRETFRDLFFSIASKRGKNYFKDLALDVEKEACKEHKGKYKNIVMGHTHLPKVYVDKDEGFRYVNCGDWIHNLTYVVYTDDKFYLY